MRGSLHRQSRHDFQIVVVDNSGQALARRNGAAPGAEIIENSTNAGFGEAVNQGIEASCSRYVAVLNDDAVAHAEWLDALVRALEQRPDAGMCASQVRLFGETGLDSAGMLVARDGSSKQRGHGRSPEDFPVLEETLFPSGSAALYRRTMLEEVGGFDKDFFLVLRGYGLGLAGSLGRVDVPVCAGGVGGASLFPFGRVGVARQGLLRGTKSLVRPAEKFPGRHASGRTGGRLGPLLLAFLVQFAGAGQRGAFSRGRQCRAFVCFGTSCGRMGPCCFTERGCGGSARRFVPARASRRPFSGTWCAATPSASGGWQLFDFSTRARFVARDCACPQ